jgi:hypothetical protein
MTTEPPVLSNTRIPCPNYEKKDQNRPNKKVIVKNRFSIDKVMSIRNYSLRFELLGGNYVFPFSSEVFKNILFPLVNSIRGHTVYKYAARNQN